MGKSNLKEKVSTTWNNVVLHWKTPALGKYVSYKEIIAYGVGGMGVQFVMFFCSLIALSATSFLVGNTIGIKPMHLQYMAVASTIIGFGITIGRSYIIDSARFKSGKFRPWLAITGIPTVIIAVVFVWLPYETMSYMQKVIAVFLCYNLLQCFYPFFQQAYTDLANVISPNSHERTDIVSVSSIIYSMAPSLTGLFVPMLSTLTGGLNSITTYRIIHPLVAVVGLLLSYVAYAGTRERIIVAESHVTQFKFSDAFRAVAKNKYFWITSLAGWLGFLEGAVGVIIGWTFIYAYPNRMGLYGVATTLIGNAALWAMLICPIAIRVLGKRNLLIWCNVTNVVLIGLLYPLYNNIPALIILYYLNGFVNSFSIVYTPGINADMRDYQQYFTGERIDGMFGAVGIIGSFIGMFTGMVLPTIYQMLGLEDNYDVLEVASFREDMFDVLIIAAVIGAALNFVPYLFYDLTETKQRGIVKVLKIRAMFEDYGNGILRDESIVEAIDIIDEANLLYKDRTLMTTKDDIKKAERLPARTPEEKTISAQDTPTQKRTPTPSTRRAESRSRDSKRRARQTSSAGNRSVWQRRTESEEQTMKKFSKIAAVVALMLVVCLSFTGCGNLGNAIISALSLDVTVDDPALIKVEDILDKTVKTESVKSGDFTYTLYTDNTACITGYTGSNPVVSIPAEIDGTKVVGLENKALKSSSTLKELILPDSIEAIGNYAAMYCDSLEKVTIGKNIKHIGISAFEGSQENAYTGKSKLTTVVFNGAPKTISEKAFYFCSALTEIVLPEGVETIGDWAFAKCFSAKKIIIPAGVTQIDDHAFLKCTGAVEISIPGTVESIAVSAFYRCSSLEKLTIGEGVKKLEKGAFEECKSLKTVVLPESMEELGKYAFYNCTGLDEITIHSGVTAFGGEIFKDVGKLTISTESGSDAEKYAQDNGFDIAVIG